MKAIFNVIALGAALTAGMISVFQNAPFHAFAKRVGVAFIVFYFIGVVLNMLWNAASVYMASTEQETDRPARSDEAEGKREPSVSGPGTAA